MIYLGRGSWVRIPEFYGGEALIGRRIRFSGLGVRYDNGTGRTWIRSTYETSHFCQLGSDNSYFLSNLLPRTLNACQVGRLGSLISFDLLPSSLNACQVDPATSYSLADHDNRSEMAEPPKSRLQSMLQAAVQSVQWTYSLFWQFCPQQGILVWSDGYYNGAIKTRKTVQPIEVTTEEATLQRSQQLRELYESLSAGETGQQTRRPSAALSPEDLTESEWFYLMCVSFSFAPGVGVPGKAYVKRQHVWLTRANEVDSKVFSRAILAKVQEDIGLIQRVKSFFIYDSQNPNPPRPVLSEHSTSNPPASSEPRFNLSPVTQPTRAPTYPPLDNSHVADDQEGEEVESDSDAETRNTLTEPMQLDHMCKDVWVGSPDGGSNNLNSDFHLLAVSRHGNFEEDHHGGGGFPAFDELAQEDTHYSQTVSTILESQSTRWSKYSSSTTMSSAASSAFSKWSTSPSPSSGRRNLLLDDASQWALKYILFTVPLLHTKSSCRSGDELISASHVLAERRREKLNERFFILRSLVPFVTKMDKASILGNTIEYLKRVEEENTGTRIADGAHFGRRQGGLGFQGMAAAEWNLGRGQRRRDGLLLNVMKVLGELGIEVTTVQSSISNGFFSAELRAKVKENENGRKASIMEVKRSINQIIPHY
ncbi:hypothetical protein DH2020_024825 [Rehmannia glutinosa]|uniref:BHLH domain-containing protein n=1 Tax=Rehmannia glutinosa TaxID=99300 RepID=A0ABR0W5N4_REHGL